MTRRQWNIGTCREKISMYPGYHELLDGKKLSRHLDIAAHFQKSIRLLSQVMDRF